MQSAHDDAELDFETAKDHAGPIDGQSECQQPSQADLTIERNTSNLIIGITNVFNSEMEYDETMMAVLNMISETLHPERLIIFERREGTTSCTFEWHADNVPPQREHMQNLPNEQFDALSKFAPGSSQVIESKTEKFGERDERAAARFNRRGINRMMAVPLISGKSTIGYLSANNYQADEGIDAKRILDTVAPFITTRIVQQRILNQLEYSGAHDELTGLLNRRGIDEAIERRLSDNPSEPFALALMDIDDFKIVNDLLGHDVGDVALRTIARNLTATFPPDAIIGRNGGDEFLAMVFGKDLDQVDFLRDTFNSASFKCEFNGQIYPLSMSAGYAVCPSQAVDLADAYVKADAALYAVKLAGKSGCKQYKPEYESQYRSQLGYTPRDIAENIPCGIAVCKVSDVGEILFANGELVRMLECDNFTDFMRHTGGVFQGIVHPDDQESTLQDLVRQMHDPSLRNKAYINHRVITKNGNIKHFADTSRVVSTSNNGDVVYVLLVDLGERVHFLQLSPE